MSTVRTPHGDSPMPVDGESSAPLFPADSGVPRRRRPSDFGRLFLAGAVFVLLGWAASGRSEPEVRLAEALSDLPGWIRTLAWIGYSTAAVVSVVLVVAAVASSSVRRDVLRDLLFALVVGVGLAFLAGRVATGEWPFVLPELFDPPGRLPYPTMRPAVVMVIWLVLGGYTNADVQRFLRWMAAVVAIAPVLLGFSTLTAVFGALALSLFSVAVVRIVFGSPDGLPSLDRLAGSLARWEVTLTNAAYCDDQPGTVGLATATTADGQPVDIKIYGQDAANRQRAERVWRTLWYRWSGPSPRAGRSAQAEHEALAVLGARAAGVNVPPLVGAGQEPNGDVVIVSVAPSGAPLGEISEPTDGQLAALWDELGSLHRSGRITHGSVGPHTVWLDGEHVQLVDLRSASLLPTEQQLATDVVSMLASQAIVVGAERAVEAAAGSVDPKVLESALPYAQAAVLEPTLRGDLKSSGCSSEELGKLLAERLEVEAPDLAPVRRVSWSDVFIAVAGVFAANALISQIADVGFATLIDELRSASLGWLAVSFGLTVMAYGTAYFALTAVLERSLPFLPTMLLQSAKSFVGLVVPSVIGRVGLDIRFLQLSGVRVIVASTQGPVIGFVGFFAEAILLALSAWAIGQELEAEEVTDFDGGGLVAIALLVVVVGIAVVFGVPSLREKVLPPIREALGSVRAILTSPVKIAKVFGSELANRLIGALALAATVAAFGAEMPFPALIFVSVGTRLLSGLAPVPGGIGVAEATMAGLLTAAGIPSEQAVSIAIVHRLVTAYLPPVFGFFSLNWLKDEGYL